MTDDRTLRCAQGSLHSSESRYLNRELSQVEFNARVLELATDADRPLLERLKFVAICAGNQDEFFRKRVGGLRAQVGAGAPTSSADGMSPSAQLEALRRLAGPIVHEQSRICEQELFPALAEAGMRLCAWSDLPELARKELRQRFADRIFPILTPLAIDPGRPFPHISSLSLNLMVVLCHPGEDERRLARVKVPANVPRYQRVDEGSFIPVEEVIAAHLDLLFPGMQVKEAHLFRVTRNADIALETGDVDDLLETIEDRLLRRRFGEAVRLEVHEHIAPDVRRRLREELELTEDEVYEVAGPLDPSDLWLLHDEGPEELKAPRWQPVVPPRLAKEGGDVFAEVAAADLLVHHPYESFDASVGAFIRAAAEDPHVVAIKLTIYRTSESESAMVDALVRAAESGKQAVALVELKARFDEQANIQRARTLEEAGVHVVYGFIGLKTHTKTLLVVRQEEGRLRRYAHVGTGNYNPRTARTYEDLGVITADPAVGEDLSHLFNILTGFSHHHDFRRLLVAPRTMRARLLDHIREEAAAGRGRIVAKVNNLVDTEVIDALYDASEAGAEVDLIVRSQCCLRPGRHGLSSRIRVRSIVGEFLEHSRIYRFGDPDGEATYYIGSADLMGRNLDRRFEVLLPVRDERIRSRLQRVLDTLLADDVLAWELREDATWVRVRRSSGLSAHDVFKSWARAQAD